MRIENFPKLKQSDHSPKRDEIIDVPYRQTPLTFRWTVPLSGFFIFVQLDEFPLHLKCRDSEEYQALKCLIIATLHVKYPEVGNVT
jgi:hypothetical protein